MVKQRMDLLELLRKRGMDGDVDLLREALRILVDGIMDAEVSAQIGAQHGERSPERVHLPQWLPQPHLGYPGGHHGVAHSQAAGLFWDLLQNGILTRARPLAPLPEILVASAPIGEVRGQHSPLAPAFQEVQHAAENVIQVHGAGLGPTAGRLQHGQNPDELLPADVAGIGMRHDYPSPDNSLSLIYFRDRRQVLSCSSRAKQA